MPHLPENPKGERIAKVMARSGICSRRDAERWIEAGRVTLNGKKLESPACVVTAKDKITVDGKPLGGAPEKTALWLYHKPAGLLTTHRDPGGRPTVFAALPKDMPRVVSVGRLDFNTEGLLLLTNDGELANHLAHPDLGWVRRYRVRIFGKPTDAHLAQLAKGMTVDGIRYRPVEVAREQETKSHSWLVVCLREGKNREIRVLFEALGLQVARLIRVSYGPFQLGKLPAGEVKKLPAQVLKEQVGEWKRS